MSSEATEGADDVRPTTAGGLWRYALLAAGFVAFAVVLFTPPGKRLAQQPSFWPILLVAVGAWSLFTVVQGFTKGRIEPFVSGFYSTYKRDTQPKRFWASMAWNGLLGCMLIGGSIPAFMQGAGAQLEARCYNEKRAYSTIEARSACETIIRNSSAAIRRTPNNASAYSQRGYAYEQIGDMTAAIADFDRVIRLTPDDASAFFNRGYAYEHLGDLPHTIADFSQVNPDAVRREPLHSASPRPGR